MPTYRGPVEEADGHRSVKKRPKTNQRTHRHGRFVGRCEKMQKAMYETRAEAEAALVRTAELKQRHPNRDYKPQSAPEDLRIYRCRHCDHFHMTSDTTIAGPSDWSWNAR